MLSASHLKSRLEPPPVADDPKPVPSHRYTNHHLPPSLQYEAWREIVHPLMELAVPERTADGFAADVKAWDLGRIVLARAAMPAAGFHRSAIQIRNSSLDHWCFVAIKTGMIQIFGKTGIREAGPGSLFVKSLRTPAEGAMVETTCVCAFVPRDFCRERVAAIDAADDSILVSGLGRLLASYLINLDRQLRWLGSADIPGVLAATRSMIDACIEPTADRIAAALTPINATLLERARETVQSNLMSPALGVDFISRELGISRSRLYRLFEDLGGVVHYIRSRRLLDAHRVLSAGTDNRTIVEIAAERDFLDPADFSRAFKREFGYSPREARLQTKHPPQHASPPIADPDQDISFGDLLLRLM